MRFKFFLLIALVNLIILVNAQNVSGVVGTTLYSKNQLPIESNFLKISQKFELAAILQPRYQIFQDTTKINGFDLRRARLILKGEVAPKFGFRLQIEFANSVKMLDAVASYKPLDYFSINIGQSKTPYCYDNYYSPITLLTINRTQIDNSLSNRENDLYGNNYGRDLGVWLSGKYSVGNEEKRRPIIDYTIGIYNGSGINVADNSKSKDLGGYLRMSPIKNLWLGGAFYSGKNAILIANLDSTANRKRTEAMISYTLNRLNVEAEYMLGKDNELERAGYYFTVSYTLIRDKCQLTARVDNYDKNLNQELNNVNKYILATSWYFNKNTRIQMEYNFVAEEDKDKQLKNNLFAIQFLASF